MAQNFATSPQVIYDTLTGDTEFMGYVGEYIFKTGSTAIDSIGIMSPGSDLPNLKSQTGLEVIIHDAADVARRDYVTDDSDPIISWKVFLVAWEGADGLTMTNAVSRMMKIFLGSSSIQTVAVSDGLGALVQTMVTIPSDSLITI